MAKKKRFLVARLALEKQFESCTGRHLIDIFEGKIQRCRFARNGIFLGAVPSYNFLKGAIIVAARCKLHSGASHIHVVTKLLLGLEGDDQFSQTEYRTCGGSFA